MIDKITKLITDKKYRFNVLLRHGFYNKWSDEAEAAAAMETFFKENL